MPTTIFTDPEYGIVGLSEEDAISNYGKENIKSYHRMAKRLESVLYDEKDIGYFKVVCYVQENVETIVGMHYIGKNAGEVIQGYTLGLGMGATKVDLDNMIGIHPTVSEEFANLTKDAADDNIDAGSCWS